MNLPPLSLYVHVPWCVQKCPYCDFNSHSQKGTIPEKEYIGHLLDDLRADLHLVQGRKLHSIFVGGGTPSLLSGDAYVDLLEQIEALIGFEDDIEITLEANPGTVESDRFKHYVQAGINRISIGVQSLQSDKLKALGRIHGEQEALNAATEAHGAGLNSFNMDLMHGLPNQSLDDALSDLRKVIELNPPHISWYQLTIEPNTQFASKPPKLPEDETLWAIQEAGQALLAEHGYQQYEISGYAKLGYRCQHNLNYWRFGDYLGIGCGAHGKITLPAKNQILRTVKVKHPRGYMDLTKPYLYDSWHVAPEDRPFEFFMNTFRLLEPTPRANFSAYTGLQEADIQTPLQKAIKLGLLEIEGDSWFVTNKGHRYLNDLLELFV
ncbi:radical SAM family heme chaperone HemW [Pseudoalteromonas luteoviolacea]|uniref:Heme chaperone HemW n=1 Tax=Pseudoalteromonas luteoviolacea S4054 TaxID=1129367 RepID=A0A0F6AGZ0_9GAMM|nr:radical SAM family heme chaperone HemW [Pseudoalteromonas luteoviolacea]AOT07166.1 YggW family oxidoreductase [Pseudoalteromonas luteoviolacea]AOT12082.1 YggW family oxidoreductase [Pseudoalteromonas luteoviolacea]AOT16995.1 YggW family oxidoreductase [Pseudoalteromonas luteoviolacea]KKE85413.1 HemN family oxidoreductase [Pseudoalteromonas luteoviolacea S4054]KZN73761.1 HemN family oxidoreductase [Pseudoalteromonas luteoviolacea S4047-1]